MTEAEKKILAELLNKIDAEIKKQSESSKKHAEAVKNMYEIKKDVLLFMKQLV